MKNRCPLPLIPELLDRLNSATIFTKIDLRNAYHQLRIKEGDEYKTAFRCRYGHYEYQVCPFGPTNAPAAFQSFINDVFREPLDVFLANLLDDMIIYSPSRAILRENNLYAKIEKCQFNTDTIDFLGYRVSPAGVGMDPEKVASLLDWPKP